MFLSQMIDFLFANSTDPDEMLHSVAFHLGLTFCQSTRLEVYSLQMIKTLCVGCVCVYVCVYVGACARVCVHVCVCVLYTLSPQFPTIGIWYIT